MRREKGRRSGEKEEEGDVGKRGLNTHTYKYVVLMGALTHLIIRLLLSLQNVY